MPVEEAFIEFSYESTRKSAEKRGGSRMQVGAGHNILFKLRLAAGLMSSCPAILNCCEE
jgi:hypothetical protein